MANMKKYKLVALGANATVAAYAVAGASSVLAEGDCTAEGLGNGLNCAKTPEQKNDLGNSISTVTNILLFVVGIAAVIMLIVGGFQYIFSSGDSGKTATAKNTILYAIVGIVVALLAYALTNFVYGKFAA